jgi:hypothetical protein
MWKTLGFASLVAVLLVICSPEFVLGQKKKDDGNKADKATPQEYTALLNQKQVAGEIFYVDPGAKVVVLRVESAEYKPNPNFKGMNPANAFKGNNNRNNFRNNNRGNNGNFMQQYARLMQQYNQAMQSQQKNPGQAQQQLGQIAMQMQKLEMQMKMQATRAEMQQWQQMMRTASTNKGNNNNNGPFIVSTSDTDYELEFVDNVPVRKLFLATEYDDMGNLKKYTKEQLAALKGKDSNKPGYEAKFDDLVPGQEVTLYLSRPKDGATNKDRPTVTMIVMTREIAAGMPGLLQQQKKKKN